MPVLRSLVVTMGLNSANYRSELNRTQKESKQSFDAVGKSSEQMASKVGTSMSKAEKSTQKMSGQMRASMQNIGYQVQDVAVQMQMGTNAFVILSQQGSQIASIFGPGGAAMGAILAIGGAVAMALTPNLANAATTTEKLEKTLDALSKVVVTNEDGVNMLSDSYAKLAREQSDMSKAQLALSITKATQAIDLANTAAKEAVESFGGLFNGFHGTATQSVIENLDETLARTGLTMGQLLNETDLYATGLSQLSSFASDLSDELGTTTEESVALIRAMKSFKSSGSPGAINDLAESVTTLSLNAKDAKPGLLQLAVDLNKLALESASSRKVLELLDNAFNGVVTEVESATNAYDELSKSLMFDISLVGKSELAQKQAIAIQRLGADATNEQVESIRNLIAEKHRLDNMPTWGETFGGTDTVDLGAVKEYARLVSSLRASDESLEQKFARESELLEQNYTDYAEYTEAKILLDKKYSDAQKAASMQAQAVIMGSQATQLDIMQQGLQGLMQYSEDGSAIAKVAFLASQAVAASQIMVTAEQAKWQAASTIPNAVAQASVMNTIDAQKYVSLGLVAAQTGAGAASIFHAGIDAIPDAATRTDNTILIEGGERVISKNHNQELMDIMRGLDGGNGGASGNVQVIVQGSIYGDEQTKKIISAAAAEGYSRVAQDAKTNGVIYKQMRR